jgi:hypothetical protein
MYFYFSNTCLLVLIFSDVLGGNHCILRSLYEHKLSLLFTMQFVCMMIFRPLHVACSDVPAWLGLKALALARPEGALAFKNAGLGQSCHSWLGLGSARARPWLVDVEIVTQAQESRCRATSTLSTTTSMDAASSMPCDGKTCQ